jgi:hypothetical protein
MLDISDIFKLGCVSKEFRQMLNPQYTQKIKYLMDYNWLLETRLEISPENATKVMKNLKGPVNM